MIHFSKYRNGKHTLEIKKQKIRKIKMKNVKEGEKRTKRHIVDAGPAKITRRWRLLRRPPPLHSTLERDG